VTPHRRVGVDCVDRVAVVAGVCPAPGGTGWNTTDAAVCPAPGGTGWNTTDTRVCPPARRDDRKIYSPLRASSCSIVVIPR
jgi:hypothetical protein